MSSPAPAHGTAALRARVLAVLSNWPPVSFALVAAVGCQAPAPLSPPADPEPPAGVASTPLDASVPVAATSQASAATPLPSTIASVAIAPSTSTTSVAPPPAAEREDPTACQTRITKCYPPRQLTSGGKVVQRELHWDKNGCLPKAETAGACAAFFPTTEPRFTGGQCCYQGCAGPLIKCGRPLLREGEPVLAALAFVTTWNTSS